MKKSFLPKITTYMGFPVGEPDAEGQGPAEGQGRQRGIAIIIALFMIAMMMIMMADMQVNTVVESELAIANRDNVKAEYLAKSGANLANLLLSADLAIDLTMAEVQGGNAQISDGPGDIWSMLNYLPIGPDKLDAMKEQFELNAVNDSDVIDMLKLFEGDFSIVVEDESSRLNVNYCGINLSSKDCTNALKALLSCPAEREFLERRKQNPTEIVGHILDWVDNNTTASEESGNGNEADPYQNRTPKVEVKNSFFDSLDEMRMVEGWDGDLHAIFSPYLTVYPMPIEEFVLNKARMKINFNSAPRELLNCLFPKATTECSEKSALYSASREDLEPAKDNQSIQQTLRDQFCAGDDENTKLFTYRSDVYRVKVSGIVGGQEKKLEYVLSRQLPDGDAKSQDKGASKYLYWKML